MPHRLQAELACTLIFYMTGQWFYQHNHSMQIEKKQLKNKSFTWKNKSAINRIGALFVDICCQVAQATIHLLESGRWNRTPFDERICHLCDRNKVGTELHYLIECEHSNTDRQIITPQTENVPHPLILSKLMSLQSVDSLVSVSKYIYILNKSVSNKN